MSSFRSAFPSKYLKASDLNGRAVIATIESVDLETVGTDSKYVARFTNGSVKPIVLNKTNCEAIADIAGSDDVETWPGHKIELYPSATEFQGKRVGCVRLRAPRPGRPERPAANGQSSVRPASRPKAPPPADDIDDAMPTVVDGGEY